MILATSDDLNYSSIDWQCYVCGVVYVSRGQPDDRRCLNGHDARWVPDADTMAEYVTVLQSLAEGDGVLFAGDGSAPLMGPVSEVGEEYIVTESIDSPARRIRWGPEECTIEQTALNTEREVYRRVYHVDTVEVMSRVE